jgi:hypothetical protein
MSVNPSKKYSVALTKKTVSIDGKGIIEFEFNRVPKPDGYEDIIVHIFNPENQNLYRHMNPLFIRDNTLFTYYKTDDKEYIRIVDAIGLVVAEVYNLKLIPD